MPTQFPEGDRSYLPFSMICGIQPSILQTTGAFSEYFRAIYYVPDGTNLTGVGHFEENKGSILFPRDENDGLGSIGTDSLCFVSATMSLSSTRDFYLIHNRCWNFILEHCQLGSTGLHYNEYDVFMLPTLEQLMQFPRPQPKARSDVAGKLAAKNMTDCFRSLPLEICEAIAINLSTRDALSLRYVSRAMVSIFESAAFWGTRFNLDGERGFLHPVAKRVLEKGTNEVNWKLLYHCTCKLKCNIDFDLQIRIWEVLRSLGDTARTVYRLKNGITDHTMPLAFGGRALQRYHTSSFSDVHHESVYITSSPHKIGIYAGNILGKIYITGLEFFFHNQPSVRMRYTTPGARVMTEDDWDPREVCHELKYKYPRVCLMINVSQLKGFNIERFRDGVRAMRVIQEPTNPVLIGRQLAYRGEDYQDGTFMRLEEIEVVGIRPL